MPSPIRRPRRPDRRRGVTLVEMLVVVALVILMMVILVQIFQSATGAMTASRTSTELDLVLRQIDGTIRSDLNGVTAKMTPPNDPKDKAGYFEYGENAPADAQGEDTDDYMAFTTKAPEGQFFTGRQYLLGPSPQPTTITSQVAEVIYFLRNGNLYRRVFLVAPDRAKSITLGTIGATHNYSTSIFGGSVTVGWQGPNDISCRPSGFTASGIAIPIPNDLGDLTNRENRAFRPRFINDFQGGPSGPDGIIDDFNADGVPDYYPTLYYDGTGYNPSFPPSGTLGWAPNGAVHEGLQYAGLQRVEAKAGNANSYDVYAFPFIFPGMYSVADPTRASNLGALHYLHPNGQINHAPLSIGDNVPTPVLPAGKQTWWGFPTWRETMAGASSTGGIGWADPVNFVSQGGTHTQPLGLRQFAAPATNLLPPITSPGSRATPDFSDGAGSTSTFVAIPAAPNRVWEDDLILTNVRSFDIKAYDLNAGLYNTTTNGYFSAGYQDLGYGANPYIRASMPSRSASATRDASRHCRATTACTPGGPSSTTLRAS